MHQLPEGLVVVCKRDCPTCLLIEPVLAALEQSDWPLTVFTQDDPAFPGGIAHVHDDRELETSYHLDIETVPTLIQVKDGREVKRLIGWQKEEWRALTGDPELGSALPDYRPGCGSRSVEPGVAEALEARFGASILNARRVQLGSQEDPVEACYARGWSDGLPVVPPTEARVLAMLAATEREPDEVVAMIPPNQAACTVEKVAISAVMAGCRPEYMTVLLTALEAACADEFCLHGVLATTYFSGPIVIVSGPISREIGMNAGGNALGQGNRANATIGRALQLIVRNVGGGRPGEIDRATLGYPGKYTFCFAENLEGTRWSSLSAQRGFPEGTSTVTLFAGGGVHGVGDQLSRDPASLSRTFVASLRSVYHTKIVRAVDAILVVSPEHSRIFEEAGWSKTRLLQELEEGLMLPSAELVRGAGGIAEGIPASMIGSREVLAKFRPGGLNIVRAGGNAGLFSAIIGGWAASGPKGSQPVTKEIPS